MMLDGDEPGSHAGQFYLNWLVTNVPVGEIPQSNFQFR